jgi:hypothetical protein
MGRAGASHGAVTAGSRLRHRGRVTRCEGWDPRRRERRGRVPSAGWSNGNRMDEPAAGSRQGRTNEPLTGHFEPIQNTSTGLRTSKFWRKFRCVKKNLPRKTCPPYPSWNLQSKYLNFFFDTGALLGPKILLIIIIFSLSISTEIKVIGVPRAFQSPRLCSKSERIRIQ